MWASGYHLPETDPALPMFLPGDQPLMIVDPCPSDSFLIGGQTQESLAASLHLVDEP